MPWKEISVAKGRTDEDNMEGRSSAVKGVMCRRLIAEESVVIC